MSLRGTSASSRLYSFEPLPIRTRGVSTGQWLLGNTYPGRVGNGGEALKTGRHSTHRPYIDVKLAQTVPNLYRCIFLLSSPKL